MVNGGLNTVQVGMLKKLGTIRWQVGTILMTKDG